MRDPKCEATVRLIPYDDGSGHRYTVRLIERDDEATVEIHSPGDGSAVFGVSEWPAIQMAVLQLLDFRRERMRADARAKDA